ncbi:hypothetical protein F4777DRAFT_123859 [Nemania sp. FL0916]|nr:hypothetical protein F4777DRAFT_123859 [Nemania sp. FL0916]
MFHSARSRAICLTASLTYTPAQAVKLIYLSSVPNITRRAAARIVFHPSHAISQACWAKKHAELKIRDGPMPFCSLISFLRLPALRSARQLLCRLALYLGSSSITRPALYIKSQQTTHSASRSFLPSDRLESSMCNTPALYFVSLPTSTAKPLPYTLTDTYSLLILIPRFRPPARLLYPPVHRRARQRGSPLPPPTPCSVRGHPSLRYPLQVLLSLLACPHSPDLPHPNTVPLFLFPLDSSLLAAGAEAFRGLA